METDRKKKFYSICIQPTFSCNGLESNTTCKYLLKKQMVFPHWDELGINCSQCKIQAPLL